MFSPADAISILTTNPEVVQSHAWSRLLALHSSLPCVNADVNKVVVTEDTVSVTGGEQR